MAQRTLNLHTTKLECINKPFLEWNFDLVIFKLDKKLLMFLE